MPNTLDVTCHLAALGDLPDGLVPSDGPDVLCSNGVAYTLPELFLATSNHRLRLALDTTRMTAAQNPDPTRQAVTVADLHHFASQVTGNSTATPAGPLENIAVIYAPALDGHLGLRGLMFDTGFHTDFDDETHNPSYDWTQWKHCCREACAVFLQTIHNTRPANERVDQAAYTTVHELAHVFNLLHVEDQQCFLRQSPAASAPPRTWYRFNAENEAYLTDCRQPSVYPGGHEFGDHSYVGGGDERVTKAFGIPPLKLKIKASCDEFLPFDPVELDMKLSVVPGCRVPRGLRNEMDPSYSNFAVWIENPRGERRRYKSINHCCENAAPCPVTQEQPFERDLTLFGQSGGYTFRHAGVHRVWITWRLSKRVVISSNTIEISIRPWLRLSSKDRDLCKALRIAGRPLFYRRRQWSRRETAALASLCTDFKGRAHRYPHAMAKYAHWQILANMSSRSSSHWRRITKSLSESGKWLKDQPLLGPHRREKVTQAIDSF